MLLNRTSWRLRVQTWESMRRCGCVEVKDDVRELAWEMAVKAGREDPASCVEVSGSAASYVVGARVIEAKDGLADDSPPGRIHAILAGGGPLDVRIDLA